MICWKSVQQLVQMTAIDLHFARLEGIVSVGIIGVAFAGHICHIYGIVWRIEDILAHVRW